MQPDFQSLFDHLPNSYMVLDRQLRFVAANRAYVAASGTTLAQLLGRYIFDVFPNNPHDPHDRSRAQLKESFERVLETRAADVVALIAYRVPREGQPGTQERFWSATHVPMLDAQGEVAFIVQHTVDITELQNLRQSQSGGVEAGVLTRAQQVQATNLSLDAERRHLRRLFDQAPGFICVLRGKDHVFELANRAYYQLVGHREVLGKPLRDALPELEGQGYIERLDRVLATGEAWVGRGREVQLQREPGAEPVTVLVDAVYQPVFEADGTVSGVFVQGHDITEQKRAQDELQRYRDQLEELVRQRTLALEQSEEQHRRAQEQLFQAQKMEAVGKLTGGVAHDFNNLLQVIGGTLEMLADEVETPQARRRLELSLRAVERGAKLSSQLLAFARRQPLAPKVVNLTRHVQRVEELLGRTLGEDVELVVSVEDGLWNALADPHQLDNVLLNLAINSREAMGGDGRLTVRARNVTVSEEDARGEVLAGDYVELSVRDTGCGMSAEVKARAFEPFFTTKAEGQGTGLGLSMVYGFVKQSGGHIELESEEGKGTEFRLLLPRTLALEAVEEPKRVREQRGREVILVVEDDPAVRATAVDLLVALGYDVHTASDAQVALGQLYDGLRPDLLFTDVVMPGPLRSPELARRARELHPSIKVLFTSGYTAERIALGGTLEPEVELLSKPYTRQQLASRVRQLLDGPSQQKRKEAAMSAAQAQPVAGVSTATEEAANALARTARVLLVEDDEDIRMATEDLVAELGFEVISVANVADARVELARGAFSILFTDVKLSGASGLELAREAVRGQPSLRVLLATGLGSSITAELRDELRNAVLLSKPYEVWQLEEALRTPDSG